MGQFGDECLQAIDCTGTDNQKQDTKHCIQLEITNNRTCH